MRTERLDASLLTEPNSATENFKKFLSYLYNPAIYSIPIMAAFSETFFRIQTLEELGVFNELSLNGHMAWTAPLMLGDLCLELIEMNEFLHEDEKLSSMLNNNKKALSYALIPALVEAILFGTALYEKFYPEMGESALGVAFGGAFSVCLQYLLIEGKSIGKHLNTPFFSLDRKCLKSWKQKILLGGLVNISMISAVGSLLFGAAPELYELPKEFFQHKLGMPREHANPLSFSISVTMSLLFLGGIICFAGHEYKELCYEGQSHIRKNWSLLNTQQRYLVGSVFGLTTLLSIPAFGQALQLLQEFMRITFEIEPQPIIWTIAAISSLFVMMLYGVSRGLPMLKIVSKIFEIETVSTHLLGIYKPEKGGCTLLLKDYRPNDEEIINADRQDCHFLYLYVNDDALLEYAGMNIITRTVDRFIIELHVLMAYDRILSCVRNSGIGLPSNIEPELKPCDKTAIFAIASQYGYRWDGTVYKQKNRQSDEIEIAEETSRKHFINLLENFDRGQSHGVNQHNAVGETLFTFDNWFKCILGVVGIALPKIMIEASWNPNEKLSEVCLSFLPGALLATLASFIVFSPRGRWAPLMYFFCTAPFFLFYGPAMQFLFHGAYASFSRKHENVQFSSEMTGAILQGILIMLHWVLLNGLIQRSTQNRWGERIQHSTIETLGTVGTFFRRAQTQRALGDGLFTQAQATTQSLT